MTDDRPDLDQAARETAESTRRAEHDKRQAMARARRQRSLAAVLRRLREENGFQAMFEDAFGGRSE